MSRQTDLGTIIDVREYPEFALGHIPGSRLVPLDTLAVASAQWDRAAPIALVCKGGARAEKARQQLVAQGFTALRVLPGGIDQWRAEGKPLAALQNKPWSLERQVRVVAGSLVLVTLALSLLASRYFLFATAFVGAGLVFAGVSDICMMASLLAMLPWNRPSPGLNSD
jgi:rhodanese-related sulfurtransferase